LSFPILIAISAGGSTKNRADLREVGRRFQISAESCPLIASHASGAKDSCRSGAMQRSASGNEACGRTCLSGGELSWQARPALSWPSNAVVLLELRTGASAVE